MKKQKAGQPLHPPSSLLLMKDNWSNFYGLLFLLVLEIKMGKKNQRT